MTNSDRITALKPLTLRLWPAILALVGMAIYGASLHGPYFLDDYVYFFDPPPRSLLYYFSHPHATGFYRPLQATLLLLIQREAGLNTLPIHLIQLLMHVGLAWMVFRWMVSRTLGTRAAMIGSLSFLCAQAAAEAVCGNDTFSQVGCALFGWASLWALWSALAAPRATDTIGRGGIALALLAAALLSKESAACFVLLFLGVCALRVRQNRALLPRALLLAALALTVFGLYWAARGAVGAAGVHISGTGTERYGFHFGKNIPINLAQFTLAAALPLSTTVAFLASAQHHVLATILCGFAALIVIGVCAWGVSRSLARHLAPGLLALTLLSLVPALFLDRVSELYVYNALPPLAVLAGIGLGQTTRRRRALYCWRGLALTALFLGGNALGAFCKGEMMAANGRKQDILMAKIVTFRPRLQPGRGLLLVDPPATGPNYSVLIEHDFDLLQDSEGRIGYLLGLPEQKVRISDRAYNGGFPIAQSGDLRLTVSPDGVDVHTMP